MKRSSVLIPLRTQLSLRRCFSVCSGGASLSNVDKLTFALGKRNAIESNLVY